METVDSVNQVNGRRRVVSHRRFEVSVFAILGKVIKSSSKMFCRGKDTCHTSRQRRGTGGNSKSGGLVCELDTININVEAASTASLENTRRESVKGSSRKKLDSRCFRRDGLLVWFCQGSDEGEDRQGVNFERDKSRCGLFLCCTHVINIFLADSPL